MSIRPHTTKPGWWFIILSRGRKQKQLVIPFEGTEAEARAYEREKKGKSASRIESKVIDVVPSFLTWYETNRMKSTSDACRLAFDSRLLQHYENMYLSLLSTTDHDQYKQARLNDGVKKRTINIELLYLRSFLKYAKGEGYDIGVFPQLYEKKYTAPRIPEVLTPTELTAFVSNLDSHAELMVLLEGKCGLRKGEVAKITPRDIRDGGLLRVVGKGDKQRLVPLPKDVLSKLEAYAKGKKEDELLFKVKDIRKRIKTAEKKAGISKHIHPHMLRHTTGTNAVRAGVQQRIIQDLLGHADIRTTEIYTRVVAESLTGAMKQMSELYEPPKSKKASELSEVKKPRKRTKKATS
jgi:integrase/recombinase XerD